VVGVAMRLGDGRGAGSLQAQSDSAAVI
jgi:hypothetical protein